MAIRKLKIKIKQRIFKNEMHHILKKEYDAQSYVSFNERPVEYAFLFKQLAAFCPGHILDVGTGVTALPQLMRTCGFHVTAIDNVKDYWPAGMQNRHYLVIDDDITKSKLKKKFEAITCISTLEHIVNFEKAIENMILLLADGGHLILSFPYNEKKYCENVYHLDDSRAPKNMPFTTQAFSRENIEGWCKKYRLEIMEQEYWRFFTGEYWSTGERTKFPERSSASAPHQITCVVLKKN